MIWSRKMIKKVIWERYSGHELPEHRFFKSHLRSRELKILSLCFFLSGSYLQEFDLVPNTKVWPLKSKVRSDPGAAAGLAGTMQNRDSSKSRIQPGWSPPKSLIIEFGGTSMVPGRSSWIHSITPAWNHSVRKLSRVPRHQFSRRAQSSDFVVHVHRIALEIVIGGALYASVARSSDGGFWYFLTRVFIWVLIMELKN